MAPNPKIVGIAFLSTALGGTLIALLAALLKRKKVKTPKPPDVLNEAQPLDLSLQTAGALGGGVSTEGITASDRIDGCGPHSSHSRLACAPLSLVHTDTSNYSIEQLCYMGSQHLMISQQLWEEALARSSLEQSHEVSTSEHLNTLLGKVKEVLVLYQAQFESDIVIDTTVAALQEMNEAYERKRGKSITSDDTSIDSFVSAPETPDLTDLEEKISSHNRLHLYEVGLLELQHNSVPYRKLRTRTVGCESDSEFLAKLHVLRIAFNQIMEIEANKLWFMQTGKRIISCILNKAERDPVDFLTAMARLEEFLPSEANFDVLKVELGMRGVKCFTLYDVVLDWVLMDAFDDLTNPPSSVLSVVQNRWLSAGLKETAISTAVWSILKAKRRILKYPDGFISKFYAISESVSPVLAWAFLGPDGDVKTACMSFKDHCMGFIQDIFNQSKVRYTTYDDITTDIMSVAKKRAQSILSVVDNS